MDPDMLAAKQLWRRAAVEVAANNRKGDVAAVNKWIELGMRLRNCFPELDEDLLRDGQDG